MELLRLRVPDAYCDGWLPAMRLAVRQLPGTGTVSLDLPATTVSIEYDPATVTLEQLQAALESVGYASSLLT